MIIVLNINLEVSPNSQLKRGSQCLKFENPYPSRIPVHLKIALKLAIQALETNSPFFYKCNETDYFFYFLFTVEH